MTTSDFAGGLLVDVVQFKASLEREMIKKIREVVPTDEEMKQYTERWLEAVREQRQVGIGGYAERYIDDEEDDKIATESEMRYKMLNFLDEEGGDAIGVMFDQINTDASPTLVRDEYLGRVLDYPYQDCEVAIYSKEMYQKINLGKCAWGMCCEFLVRVVNELVEKWMLVEVRKYIVRGHAI
jgi:hypothetical protein